MLANPSQPCLLTFQAKLSYQETELVTLLKRLPLAHAELAIIREKAELLQQGQLKRGDAVLPIMLATFIFEVLCPKNGGSQAKRQATVKLCETTQEDEELGFQATLFVLGTAQFTWNLPCENSRFSSLLAAWDVSFLFWRNGPIGDVRGVTTVFAGKGNWNFLFSSFRSLNLQSDLHQCVW